MKRRVGAFLSIITISSAFTAFAADTAVPSLDPANRDYIKKLLCISSSQPDLHHQAKLNHQAAVYAT